MTALSAEPPIDGFRSFSLQPGLQDALDRVGYLTPTPIQAALIPPALTGRDMIGQAQTGTGKTASFLVPFFNTWRPGDSPGPQAIVLAPTRELVAQVADEAKKLSPDPECKTVVVYGGQRIQKQLRELKEGCAIVVGSPGRVLDHLNRGSLNLGRIRYAVLDEADRMLDIGFRPDIERILRRCPAERQTMLLSATLSDDVLRLAKRYMIDPLHINLSPDTLTVDKIQQRYITVDEDRKFELLCRLLERESPRQCIIFCQRKRWAEGLFQALKEEVPGVASMHGDMEQTKREKVMADFREGKVSCLVATDVVGRGIDVQGISHVINYDLPDDIENYVHRIGRTGRMGKDGMAISFVTPEQGKLLTSIEATINKLIVEDRIDGFRAFRPRPAVGPNPPAADKPKQVFGRQGRRYSSRL